MTENATDLEETDPAHRLHALCSSISSTANSIVFDGNRGSVHAWFRTAEAIPPKLGFPSYGAMNAQFIVLASQVLSGIEQLAVRKESVRDDWRRAVNTAQSVFDAKNFGTDTGTVMARCFPGHVLATLDTISERFQTSGMIDAPRETLREAFEAIRDAIEVCEKAPDIPPDLVRVLRHLLQQMEAALATYEVVGEAGFWSLYRETFATFVKVHPYVAGTAQEKPLREKLEVVTKYAVGATHLTASIATVVHAIALLTGG